jgi:hypothetical protein
MALKKTTEQFAKELLDRQGLILVSEYEAAHKNVMFMCSNGHEGKGSPTNLLNRKYTCKECKHGHTVINKKTWTFQELELLVDKIDAGSSIHECAKMFKTTEVALRKVCEINNISFKADNIKLINKVREGLDINGYIAKTIPTSITIDDMLVVTCINKGHSTEAPIKALLYYGKYCNKCKQEDILSSLTVKLQEQGRVLDYDTYNGITDKVDITCANGHTVSQYAGQVVYANRGCRVCFSENGTSKAELSLRAYIEQQYKGWIVYNDRTVLDGKELDIVLPDMSLAFEFNGTYWHQHGNRKPVDYHKSKTELAEYNEYHLVHISDYLWTTKQDIVKSRIKQLLHISEKIAARKTIVKQIPFPRDFLESNHLQGAGSPTSTNYGLYLDNDLIAVMTFGRPRFTKDQEWELVRFATKQGISVQGGASKLFKHFVKQNAPKSIVSYAARDFSMGNLYYALGFNHSHNSEPGYAYYNRQLSRISRYQAQKHKLEALLPLYDPKLSESDNMQLNGYYKVYDSGNMVFTWHP